MANRSNIEKHIQTVLVSLITAGILWIGFSLTKLGADVNVIQAAVSRLENKIQLFEGDHYLLEAVEKRVEKLEGLKK